MDLQREQSEILDVVDSMKLQGRTKGWSKYYGDVVCRIVAYYLNKHLPSNLKVVGPNAYIVGFPTEFDLLVANTKAKLVKFTNAYPADQVYCVIEVKTQGIRSKLDIFSAVVGRIRDNFQSVVKTNSNLKCTYIAIGEASPAQESSKSFNFVKETRKALEPFPFFVLRNSRNEEPYEGQWESFVKFILAQDMKS